jgi:glycosyltransferase involved in cell wall biosynthesis
LKSYVTDEILRRRHGAAGRARASAHFSLRAMVGGYVSLYDALLSGRAGALHVKSSRAGHEEQ